MKVIDGVKLFGLNIVMRPALRAVDIVYARYGVEAVITSTTEGVHSAGSYHPYGYAFDVRTRDLPGVHMARFIAEITVEIAKQARLLWGVKPAKFQVIVESNHLHVEYEVDK
ncbi:MAG: hypothetical protein WC547_09240 [Candidatus Omnitrophota bacterium]